MFRRVLLSVVCALLTFSSAPVRADSLRDEVDAWHAQRIENLRRDDGWLTLVGLFALQPGRQLFGSAEHADCRLEGDHPAEIAWIEVDDDGVFLTAIATTTHDGEPVDRVELAADVTGNPTILESGSLLFYLIERNGKPYLRVKDRNAPLLVHFEGIERWPVREEYRVEAEWIAYDPPETIQIPSVLGYAEDYACPGEVRFELGGAVHTLRPSDVDGDSMFFVFGDATNGVESYGAGRFLVTEGVRDGKVILDFNRAYNPPCVFTPFATCPLPPEGNVIDVEVRAGEKMWGEQH